jgi:ribosomal protein S18 acetylase RimI-like enzyme
MGLSFSKGTPPSSYPETLPAYLEKLNDKLSTVVIERILSESDVEIVVPVMARSFTLTPERWYDWAIGPDFALGTGDDHDEKRVHFVECSMRWVFYTCIFYGVILVAKDRTTGNILGVVCALPPENNYTADNTSLLRFHMMKIIMKMNGSHIEILSNDALRRTELMDETMHRMHETAVAATCGSNGGKEQQPWYVQVLAISQKAQGTGCGTMLLQAIHHLADHDKVDTILETSGEANIGFFCRPKLGYTKVGPEVSSADLSNTNGSDDPVITAQSLVRHPIIAVAAEDEN